MELWAGLHILGRVMIRLQGPNRIRHRTIFAATITAITAIAAIAAIATTITI